WSARFPPIPSRRPRRATSRCGRLPPRRAGPWLRRRRTPPLRPPCLSCSRRWRAPRPRPLGTTHYAACSSYSFLFRFGKEAPAEDGLEACQRESGRVARLHQGGRRVIDVGLRLEQVENRSSARPVAGLLHPVVLPRHLHLLAGEVGGG